MRYTACRTNYFKYRTKFNLMSSARERYYLRWIYKISFGNLHFRNINHKINSIILLHKTSMACNCVSTIRSGVITSHRYSAVSFMLTSRTCKSPFLNSVIRGGGNLSGCRESTINSSSRDHRIYVVGAENQIQIC